MDSSTPCLSSLRRHTISIILAYLQEETPSSSSSSSINHSLSSSEEPTSPSPVPIQPHNRDALSLLLTTKRFAYAILPLFRVPKQVCKHYQYKLKDGTYIAIVEKYRFVVLPIQDPTTLLDRLNTKRLRQRIIWSKTEAHTRGNESAINNICYQYGRSTGELAFEEWEMMQIHHHDVTPENAVTEWRIWPAHLELLRFLDYKDVPTHDNNKMKHSNLSKLPFCLLPNKSKGNVNNTSGHIHALGHGVVLLASYPRSGNTLLRTLLERTTAVVTGSDTRPDRTLSKSLAMQYDLVGEGLVGNSCCTITSERSKQSSLYLQNLLQTAYDPSLTIVKTHFPERKGWKPVKSDRVVLLIRNPYDAIDSYWNLCCTNTHTRSLDEAVYKKYASKFDSLARHEIQIWCDFHNYWLDLCKKEGVSLLVVRYEDLVLDPEIELQRVVAFLKADGGDDDESLVGDFWKWRIRHAIGKSDKTESDDNVKGCSTSNLGSYQPRSSSGGMLSIGKTLRKSRYSESTLMYMHDFAKSVEENRHKTNAKFSLPKKKQQMRETLLQKFGYDIYSQNFPENFQQPPPVPSYQRKQSQTQGSVTINKTAEIRSKDDEFGRKMTHWRRGETDNDINPFPTVARR